MASRPPRLKRSDLPTFVILSFITVYGTHAADALTDIGWPPKVVLAAIMRDVRRGYLDYGVSAWRPWVTAEGHEHLKE
ncbi:hypothetical protein [Streptomyces chartreusis]